MDIRRDHGVEATWRSRKSSMTRQNFGNGYMKYWHYYYLKKYFCLQFNSTNRHFFDCLILMSNLYVFIIIIMFTYIIKALRMNFNPLTAKLLNLNLHPLKVVSR